MAVTLESLILELKAEDNASKVIDAALSRARQQTALIEKTLNRLNSLKVTTKVDDSRLTELNKHLESKRKHTRSIQQEWNISPLAVRVNDIELVRLKQSLKEVRSLDGMSVNVKATQNSVEKNQEKASYATVAALYKILNVIDAIPHLIKENTRETKPSRGIGAVINNVATGFTQGVGHVAGSKLGAGAAKTIGIDFEGQGRILGLDLKNKIKRFQVILDSAFVNLLNFPKGTKTATQLVKKNIDAFYNNFTDPAFFAELEDYVVARMQVDLPNAPKSEIENIVAENLQKIRDRFEDVIEADTARALGATIKLAAQPLRIRKRVQLGDSAGISQKQAKIHQNFYEKNRKEIEQSEGIGIFVGGTAPNESKPGAPATRTTNTAGAAFKTMFPNAFVDTVEPQTTVSVEDLEKGLFHKVLREQILPWVKENQETLKGTFGDKNIDDVIGNLANFHPVEASLRQHEKGYSEDAIKMASKAMGAAQAFPDKDIFLAGASGGGFIVEEAVAILNQIAKQYPHLRKALSKIKGVGIGTPVAGLTATSKQGKDDPVAFKAYMGNLDHVGKGFYGKNLYEGKIDPKSNEYQALEKELSLPGGALFPSNQQVIMPDWGYQHEVGNMIGDLGKPVSEFLVQLSQFLKGQEISTDDSSQLVSIFNEISKLDPKSEIDDYIESVKKIFTDIEEVNANIGEQLDLSDISDIVKQLEKFKGVKLNENELAGVKAQLPTVKKLLDNKLTQGLGLNNLPGLGTRMNTARESLGNFKLVPLLNNIINEIAKIKGQKPVFPQDVLDVVDPNIESIEKLEGVLGKSATDINLPVGDSGSLVQLWSKKKMPVRDYDTELKPVWESFLAEVKKYEEMSGQKYVDDEGKLNSGAFLWDAASIPTKYNQPSYGEMRGKHSEKTYSGDAEKQKEKALLAFFQMYEKEAEIFKRDFIQPILEAKKMIASGQVVEGNAKLKEILTKNPFSKLKDLASKTKKVGKSVGGGIQGNLTDPQKLDQFLNKFIDTIVKYEASGRTNTGAFDELAQSGLGINQDLDKAIMQALGSPIAMPESVNPVELQNSFTEDAGIEEYIALMNEAFKLKEDLQQSEKTISISIPETPDLEKISEDIVSSFNQIEFTISERLAKAQKVLNIINTGLSLTPGGSGEIDLSSQITSLDQFGGKQVAQLAGKGLGTTGKALQGGANATIGALLPAAKVLYGAVKGIENVTLAMLPGGRVAKSLLQQTAVPAAAFGAATHFVPGGGMLAEGATHLAQGALNPILAGAGQELALSIGGAIQGSLEMVPLVGHQLGAAITQGLTSSLGAASGAAAEIGATVGTSVLGGKALLGAGGQAAKAVLSPANVKEIQALPAAAKDIEAKTQKSVTEAVIIAKKVIGASKEFTALKGAGGGKAALLAQTLVGNVGRAIKEVDTAIASLPPAKRMGEGAQLASYKGALVKAQESAKKFLEENDPTKAIEILAERLEDTPDIMGGLLHRPTAIAKGTVDVQQLGKDFSETRTLANREQKAAKAAEDPAIMEQKGLEARRLALQVLAHVNEARAEIDRFMNGLTQDEKKKVSGKVGSARKQLTVAEKDAKKIVGNINPEDATKELGQFTGGGLSVGLRQSIESVKKVSLMLSQAVTKTIKEDQEIASPSKKMKRLGTFMAQGFIEGLKALSGSSKVTQKELDVIIKNFQETAKEINNTEIKPPTVQGFETKQEALDRDLIASIQNAKKPQQSTNTGEAQKAAAEKLIANTTMPALPKGGSLQGLGIINPENKNRLKEIRGEFNQLAQEYSSLLTTLRESPGEILPEESEGLLSITSRIQNLKAEYQGLSQGDYIRIPDVAIDNLPTVPAAFKAVRASIDDLTEKMPWLKQFRHILSDIGRTALMVVGINTLGDVFVNFGRTAFDAAVEAERFSTAISFSTGKDGTKVLADLEGQADRLGTSYKALREGYKGFSSAVMGTELEPQTDVIFEGFQKGLSVRDANAEQQKMALLAVSQMASKGKVSMEELNRQLSDSGLAGASHIAARALGVTTAELFKLVETGQVLSQDLLPKMAAQLDRESAGGLEAAASSLESQLTKLDNKLTVFKENMGKPTAIVMKTVGFPVVNAALDLAGKNTALIGVGLIGISIEVARRVIPALWRLATETKLVSAILKALELDGVNSFRTLGGAITSGLKALIIPAAVVGGLYAAFRVFTAGSKEIKDASNSAELLNNKLKETDERLKKIQENNSNKNSWGRIFSLGADERFRRNDVIADFKGVESITKNAQASLNTIKPKLELKFSSSGQSLKALQDQLAEVARLKKEADKSGNVKVSGEAAKEMQTLEAYIAKLQTNKAPLLDLVKTDLATINSQIKDLQLQETLASNTGDTATAENIKKQIAALQTDSALVLKITLGANPDTLKQQIENAKIAIEKLEELRPANNPGIYRDDEIPGINKDIDKKKADLEKFVSTSEDLLKNYDDAVKSLDTSFIKLANSVKLFNVALSGVNFRSQTQQIQTQLANNQKYLSGNSTQASLDKENRASNLETARKKLEEYRQEISKFQSEIYAINPAEINRAMMLPELGGMGGGASSLLAELENQGSESIGQIISSRGDELSPQMKEVLTAAQAYAKAREDAVGTELEISNNLVEQKKALEALIHTALQLKTISLTAGKDYMQFVRDLETTQARTSLKQAQLNNPNISEKDAQRTSIAEQITNYKNQLADVAYYQKEYLASLNNITPDARAALEKYTGKRLEDSNLGDVRAAKQRFDVINANKPETDPRTKIDVEKASELLEAYHQMSLQSAQLGENLADANLELKKMYSSVYRLMMDFATIKAMVESSNFNLDLSIETDKGDIKRNALEGVYTERELQTALAETEIKNYEAQINNLDAYRQERLKIIGKATNEERAILTKMLGAAPEEASLGQVLRAQNLDVGEYAPAHLQGGVQEFLTVLADVGKAPLALQQARNGLTDAELSLKKITAQTIEFRDALASVKSLVESTNFNLDSEIVKSQTNVKDLVLSDSLTEREMQIAEAELEVWNQDQKIKNLKAYQQERLNLVGKATAEEREVISRMLGGIKPEEAGLDAILKAQNLNVGDFAPEHLQGNIQELLTNLAEARKAPLEVAQAELARTNAELNLKEILEGIAQLREALANLRSFVDANNFNLDLSKNLSLKGLKEQQLAGTLTEKEGQVRSAEMEVNEYAARIAAFDSYQQARLDLVRQANSEERAILTNMLGGVVPETANLQQILKAQNLNIGDFAAPHQKEKIQELLNVLAELGKSPQELADLNNKLLDSQINLKALIENTKEFRDTIATLKSVVDSTNFNLDLDKVLNQQDVKDQQLSGTLTERGSQLTLAEADVADNSRRLEALRVYQQERLNLIRTAGNEERAILTEMLGGVAPEEATFEQISKAQALNIADFAPTHMKDKIQELLPILGDYAKGSLDAAQAQLALTDSEINLNNLNSSIETLRGLLANLRGFVENTNFTIDFNKSFKQLEIKQKQLTNGITEKDAQLAFAKNDVAEYQQRLKALDSYQSERLNIVSQATDEERAILTEMLGGIAPEDANIGDIVNAQSLNIADFAPTHLKEGVQELLNILGEYNKAKAEKLQTKLGLVDAQINLKNATEEVNNLKAALAALRGVMEGASFKTSLSKAIGQLSIKQAQFDKTKGEKQAQIDLAKLDIDENKKKLKDLENYQQKRLAIILNAGQKEREILTKMLDGVAPEKATVEQITKAQGLDLAKFTTNPAEKERIQDILSTASDYAKAPLDIAQGQVALVDSEISLQNLTYKVNHLKEALAGLKAFTDTSTFNLDLGKTEGQVDLKQKQLSGAITEKDAQITSARLDVNEYSGKIKALQTYQNERIALVKKANQKEKNVISTMLGGIDPEKATLQQLTKAQGLDMDQFTQNETETTKANAQELLTILVELKKNPLELGQLTNSLLDAQLNLDKLLKDIDKLKQSLASLNAYIEASDYNRNLTKALTQIPIKQQQLIGNKGEKQVQVELVTADVEENKRKLKDLESYQKQRLNIILSANKDERAILTKILGAAPEKATVQQVAKAQKLDLAKVTTNEKQRENIQEILGVASDYAKAPLDIAQGKLALVDSQIALDNLTYKVNHLKASLAGLKAFIDANTFKLDLGKATGQIDLKQRQLNNTIGGRDAQIISAQQEIDDYTRRLKALEQYQNERLNIVGRANQKEKDVIKSMLGGVAPEKATLQQLTKAQGMDMEQFTQNETEITKANAQELLTVLIELKKNPLEAQQLFSGLLDAKLNLKNLRDEAVKLKNALAELKGTMEGLNYSLDLSTVLAKNAINLNKLKNLNKAFVADTTQLNLTGVDVEQNKQKLRNLQKYQADRLKILRAASKEERAVLKQMLGGVEPEQATVAQIAKAQNADTGNIKASENLKSAANELLGTLKDYATAPLEIAQTQQALIDSQIQFQEQSYKTLNIESIESLAKGFRDAVHGIWERYEQFIEGLTDQVLDLEQELKDIKDKIGFLDIKNSLRSALSRGSSGIMKQLTDTLIDILGDAEGVAANMRSTEKEELQIERFRRDNIRQLESMQRDYNEALKNLNKGMSDLINEVKGIKNGEIKISVGSDPTGLIQNLTGRALQDPNASLHNFSGTFGNQLQSYSSMMVPGAGQANQGQNILALPNSNFVMRETVVNNPANAGSQNQYRQSVQDLNSIRAQMVANAEAAKKLTAEFHSFTPHINATTKRINEIFRIYNAVDAKGNLTAKEQGEQQWRINEFERLKQHGSNLVNQSNAIQQQIQNLSNQNKQLEQVAANANTVRQATEQSVTGVPATIAKYIVEYIPPTSDVSRQISQMASNIPWERPKPETTYPTGLGDRGLIDRNVAAKRENLEANKQLRDEQNEALKLDIQGKIDERKRQLEETVKSTRRRFEDLQREVEALTYEYRDLNFNDILGKQLFDITGDFSNRKRNMEDFKKELTDMIQDGNKNIEEIITKINESSLSEEMKDFWKEEAKRIIAGAGSAVEAIAKINKKFDDLVSQDAAKEADAKAFTIRKAQEDKYYRTNSMIGSAGSALLDARSEIPLTTDAQSRIFKAQSGEISQMVAYQEQLRETRNQLRELGLEGTGTAQIILKSMEEVNNIKLANLRSEMSVFGQAMNDFKAGVSNSMVSALTSFAKAETGILESMKNLVIGILESIAEIAAKIAAQEMIKSFFGMMGMGGSSGGLLGNLLGGIVPIAKDGWEVQNFASGGTVGANSLGAAMRRERASGVTPVPVVAHVGEQILSTKNNDAQFYRTLKAKGTWDALKSGGIDNFAYGGAVGRVAPSGGGTMRQERAIVVNSPITVVSPKPESYRKTQKQIASEQEYQSRRAYSRFR